MKLLTKAIEKATPPLYANEHKSPEEVKITAKYFTPTSSWTWYMTELDPESLTAFGYCDDGRGGAELGYFSLIELKEVKGPFGVGVERDLYYGDHTLAEVLH
jgi:hypothetical protein